MILILPSNLSTISPLRDACRRESSCQIIYDSFLPRDLAVVYEIRVDNTLTGYGAVSNTYDTGRLVEFYVTPDVRASTQTIGHDLLKASRATHIAAQTNIPLMHEFHEAFASDSFCEKILFTEGVTTNLKCPEATFRKSRPDDSGPDGEWVLEVSGSIAAAGGVLTHYNPPYGDIYMKVRRGGTSKRLRRLPRPGTETDLHQRGVEGRRPLQS